MRTVSAHSFHIPVMGLGFTIDTPVKVARFGISSVISIIEDELIEQMRKFHSEKAGESYTAIMKNDADCRAKRITAYLNLVKRIVDNQMKSLVKLPFEPGNDITKYFELLADESPLKIKYMAMLEEENMSIKKNLQEYLRNEIKAGGIDVNIMSKVDKTNYNKEGETLSAEYSDALASLRGFAESNLESSIVFSAGYNPRLYGYIDTFPDFFPDQNGCLKKKIILKVSDYRSAVIQGKILAKKGIWVSEFRIESGLNCGGHAFATDGLLLGPILEEFKEKRAEIIAELFTLCNNTLREKGCIVFNSQPELKITVQGGIGTASENKFLIDYYGVDSTGWGSPFLLVPEATNVDKETLQQLATAKKEDYYVSYASPLGIPFNNFRMSTSEQQRLERINKGRPGSPCYKKFLVTNTEFTEKPICTASREYQHLKIKQLNEMNLAADVLQSEVESITVKACLCEGLGASALLKDGMTPAHGLSAVAICPGPNLAYFSNTYSLKQMVDHIYGRITILNNVRRPNMFVNELSLYVDYLRKEIDRNSKSISDKQRKYFTTFKNNLMSGIEYYKTFIPKLNNETTEYLKNIQQDILKLQSELASINIPVALAVAMD